MSDFGAIFLHRKFQNHPFWLEPRKLSRAEAWIDILWEVRWQEFPEKVLIGNQIVECGYAQSLNSLLTWARRWRWSEPSVRRFIITLEKEGMIRRETVAKTTRLTVCNYKQYQNMRRQDDVDLTPTRRHGDAEVTTEEEVKERQERQEEKIKTLCASSDAPSTQGTPLKRTRKQPQSTQDELRMLLGEKRHEAFLQFWDLFNYKRGLMGAAKAWKNIPPMRNGDLQKILEAAKLEAERRPSLVAQGRTPKMAQGWINERRWEDDATCDTFEAGW